MIGQSTSFRLPGLRSASVEWESGWRGETRVTARFLQPARRDTSPRLVITNITKFLSLKSHNTSFLPSDSRFQSKYNDNDGATESEEGIE